MSSKRLRTVEGHISHTQDELAFSAPPTPTLSIAGSSTKIPVRRVYCVGRNYYDHGVEMGGNPDREPPFFFLKPADAVVDTSLCAKIPYPHACENFHFECEMVLVINTPDGKPIGNVRAGGADKYIYGYAVGIDLTRRDLQKEAKDMRRCWSSSKGFDLSAPIGAVSLASSLPSKLDDAMMELTVNGESKQRSSLEKMIWKNNEIIAHLSSLWDLCPGDVIFTGTPAGVGPLVSGDTVHATVAGLEPCSFTVGKKLTHYNAGQVDGMVWPAFGGLETEQMALDLIEKFSGVSKPTDVWVATYPKCGTTWTHQIALLLLNGGDSSAWDSDPHGFAKHEGGLASWPEMQFLRQGTAHFSALAEVPEPRIIKTHAPWGMVPGGGKLANGCRAIYVARNPKDACVSMMYHAQRGFGFDGDWAQWLELWLSGEVEFGSWFDHTFGWWNATKEEGNAERIMFITYEQLQFENRKTVASLASFIGVSGAGDALFDKVEAAASFGTMQAQAQQRADKGQSAPTGNAASAGNPGFFRKGEVGDWRNHFTKEQSDEFDRMYLQKKASAGCGDLTFDFGGGLVM